MPIMTEKERQFRIKLLEAKLEKAAAEDRKGKLVVGDVARESRMARGLPPARPLWETATPHRLA